MPIDDVAATAGAHGRAAPAWNGSTPTGADDLAPATATSWTTTRSWSRSARGRSGGPLRGDLVARRRPDASRSSSPDTEARPRRTHRVRRAVAVRLAASRLRARADDRSPARGARAARRALRMVTPEPAPLAIFGAVRIGERSRAKLGDAGVGFSGNTIAKPSAATAAVVVEVWPGPRRFAVDRVVALPRALGPRHPGAARRHRGLHRHRRALPGPRHDPRVGGRGRNEPHARDGWPRGAAGRHRRAGDRTAGGRAGSGRRRTHRCLQAQLRTGRGSLWLQRDISDPLDPGSASGVPRTSPPGKIAARRLGALLAERDAPGGLQLARVG